MARSARRNWPIGRIVFLSLWLTFLLAPLYWMAITSIKPSDDYMALPPLKRDVEGAKQLLKEAGFANGLEITIDVGNTDGPWHQTVCEAMRDQMKEAGITLKINVMPAAKFWEIWDKTLFGITAWTHRPLGTMAMSLAYRTGVPWNESHYANPEFDGALIPGLANSLTNPFHISGIAASEVAASLALKNNAGWRCAGSLRVAHWNIWRTALAVRDGVLGRRFLWFEDFRFRRRRGRLVFLKGRELGRIQRGLLQLGWLDLI